MNRLVHVTFQGFTVGLRVADQFVLKIQDVNAPLNVAALHSIKNLLFVSEYSRFINALGVNGVLYVPGGK